MPLSYEFSKTEFSFVLLRYLCCIQGIKLLYRFATILNIAKIAGKSGCNCGCGEPQNLDAPAKIIFI